MTRHRLLPVLLVLLQSGLAARAHEHSEDTGLGSGHSTAPHVHARDLLDLVLPHLPGEEDRDTDADHDADAIYLTSPAAAVSSSPANAAERGPATAPFDATTTGSDADRPPSLLGLPPPTAGPTRPLYLTHCALRN